MIEVRNLAKTYGAERAVDGISFNIRQGEVVGFLGPNGAGKSTTMRVITGYLPATEGTVLVNGMEVAKEPIAIREQIGYLPESTPLYRDMVTYDYLEFVAAVRGVPVNERTSRITRITHACGLGSVLSKRIETLSKGFRQRVGLAQAMIHDPPILLLDEPTSGLDPNQIVEIRDLIRKLGKEKTVVLSTHILPEVQASCDRVIIIHHGKLVADGSPQDLQASFVGDSRVQYSVLAPGADAAAAVREHLDVEVLDQSFSADGETTLTLTAAGNRDIRESLFRLAIDQGWTLTGLRVDSANLEDVFRQLTAA